MVRGGGVALDGYVRACLAVVAARRMILLALPCLAVQHNMHQMRLLVLQGALFLTKKKQMSLSHLTVGLAPQG
jgi:hypothetical protein